MKTSSPTCPKCQGAEFQLRVLRDEAVAAARCVQCSADYLLLDSKDYWFDVIQNGYPRLTRCSCKNESFRLSIDYNIREDGEIDYIKVHSTCSACAKTRRQLAFDIDYGGTSHLLKKPLVPCKNPRILYDLKDLHLLLTLPDMFRIVDHLAKQGCAYLSRLRRADGWASVRQNTTRVKTTLEKRKYLFVYAMPDPIDVLEAQVNTNKKEDAFWKRSEVIRIGSRSHVCTYQREDNPRSICYCSDPPTHASYTEVGLSLDINFSNEFIQGEKVVQKSEAFRKVTAGLLAMLQKEFVSWRSPYCFDNPEVNIRIFGDRFQKIARGRSRP